MSARNSSCLILSAAVSIRSRTGVIIFKIEGVERAESLWGEKERKVTVEGSEKKERRAEGGEEKMVVASQKEIHRRK